MPGLPDTFEIEQVQEDIEEVGEEANEAANKMMPDAMASEDKGSLNEQPRPQPGLTATAGLLGITWRWRLPR